ncbi:MAG: hypothetical protein AAGA60_09480 [Cyanobacteria bacterium P01_E01_bin.42]
MTEIKINTLLKDKAIAAVTELSYCYWGNTKNCDDYQDAIECDAFWPSFPEETPVYHAESFVCIAIGDEVYLKDFGSLRERDTREAEVYKLKRALSLAVLPESAVNVFLRLEALGFYCVGRLCQYSLEFGPEPGHETTIVGDWEIQRDYLDGVHHIPSHQMWLGEASFEEMMAAINNRSVEPRKIAIGRCPMPALTAGRNND